MCVSTASSGDSEQRQEVEGGSRNVGGRGRVTCPLARLLGLTYPLPPPRALLTTHHSAVSCIQTTKRSCTRAARQADHWCEHITGAGAARQADHWCRCSTSGGSPVRVHHWCGCSTSGGSLVRVHHWCGCIIGAGASLVWVHHWCGCITGAGASLVWVHHWCGCITGAGASLVRVSPCQSSPHRCKHDTLNNITSYRKHLHPSNQQCTDSMVI